MRPDKSRTVALAGAAALIVLGVGGCADVSGKTAYSGPSPAKSLSAELSTLAKSDLGQYYVTPSKDLSKEDRDKAVAGLKAESDLVVVVEQDGRLNITFHGNPKPERRVEILKQLVAIGQVTGGV